MWREFCGLLTSSLGETEIKMETYCGFTSSGSSFLSCGPGPATGTGVLEAGLITRLAGRAGMLCMVRVGSK